MTANNKPLKPGTKTPQSGQYIQVGPQGGKRGPNETTSVAGKPLPPTKQPGDGYKLVDPTKHKKQAPQQP